MPTALREGNDLPSHITGQALNPVMDLMSVVSPCPAFVSISLWSVAASSRYPHLKKARDILLYNNEWRALFLDDNRRNRSHFFDWDILDTINNTDRRTSETFTFGGFYFRVSVKTRIILFHPPLPFL